MWKSQKQPCVALSTAEAELVALTEGAKQALYVKSLVEELFCLVKINIFTDNQSSLTIASFNASLRKVKHMDIKLRFIQEFLKNDNVTIFYLPTEKICADLLTKPLPRKNLSTLLL